MRSEARGGRNRRERAPYGATRRAKNGNASARVRPERLNVFRLRASRAGALGLPERTALARLRRIAPTLVAYPSETFTQVGSTFCRLRRLIGMNNVGGEVEMTGSPVSPVSRFSAARAATAD